MDILYLLIPLSAGLVLAVLAVFAWALNGGQFDDLEQHGAAILDSDSPAFDRRQAGAAAGTEESAPATEPKDRTDECPPARPPPRQ